MKTCYHLPGLFEFHEFYKVFLPLFREHGEYFLDDCGIGSIYGAPGDCLWGGGRVGFGDANPEEVARKAVENASDIRTELVESIKDRVKNGTYDVDPDKFADRIFEKFV